MLQSIYYQRQVPTECESTSEDAKSAAGAKLRNAKVVEILNPVILLEFQE